MGLPSRKSCWYGKNVFGLSDFDNFSSENLENVKIIFEEKGFDTHLYNLNNEIKEIEKTGIFDISKFLKF